MKQFDNYEKFISSLNSNQYAAWCLFIKHHNNDPDEAAKWISVLHNHKITVKFNYSINEYDYQNLINNNQR